MDEKCEQKNLIDYIALDEKFWKDVLDVKAVRGMYEGLEHYVVLVKIKIKDRWEYGKKKGEEKVSKVLASEWIDRKG